MPLWKPQNLPSHSRHHGEYSYRFTVASSKEKATVNPEANRRLQDFIYKFQSRYSMPDYTAVLIPAIVYCGNKIEGAPPLWMSLVGASSSGKTTAVNYIRDLDRVMELGDVSLAGLLSGAERGDEASGGILQKVMEHGGWAIFTFKDMTTIASKDSKSMHSVLSAFREIYDGSWERHSGAEGGRHLAFSGKCGLIAGMTPGAARIIHSAQEMGERCLSIQLPAVKDTTFSHVVAENAIRNLSMHSTVVSDEELRDAYVSWIAAHDLSYRQITQEATARLAGYAQIISSCRVRIERDRKHIIKHEPDPEYPARAGQQLYLLYVTARALGIGDVASWNIVRNTVSSTMPYERTAATRILTRLLAKKKHATLKEIMELPYADRSMGLHCWTKEESLRAILEELSFVGVIQSHQPKIGSPLEYRWGDGEVGKLFQKLM
jgi:hypothetical protein